MDSSKGFIGAEGCLLTVVPSSDHPCPGILGDLCKHMKSMYENAWKSWGTIQFFEIHWHPWKSHRTMDVAKSFYRGSKFPVFLQIHENLWEKAAYENHREPWKSVKSVEIKRNQWKACTRTKFSIGQQVAFQRCLGKPRRTRGPTQFLVYDKDP